MGCYSQMKYKILILIGIIFMASFFIFYLSKTEDMGVNNSFQKNQSANTEQVEIEQEINSSEEILENKEKFSSGGGGSSSSSSSTLVQEEILTDTEEFAEIYNLTYNTIIFYYSDDIHSLNMVPIVEELEQNYTFYKTEDIWDKNAQEYLDMVGTTPIFICIKNNEKIVGEISKEGLESFAQICN